MSDLEILPVFKTFVYKDRNFNFYTSSENLDAVCKFPFLPTDIIVATFSRSGTTFTQEIVWQIKNRKTVEKNEKVEMTMKRFPFLEFDEKRFQVPLMNSFDMLSSQKNDPYRLIKTHVPYEFIKENVEKANSKLIVVMRNAKDCLVSNYHFHSNTPLKPFQGSFDDYFNVFIEGKTFSGSYFDNNLQWWSLRNRSNVLILFYEELVTDIRRNVRKIAEFMGDEITDEDIDKIVNNCSFSTMFDNPKINMKFNDNFTHLRKGIIGDWKNHLSVEQNIILDKMIDSKFEKAGLKFNYE